MLTSSFLIPTFMSSSSEIITLSVSLSMGKRSAREEDIDLGDVGDEIDNLSHVESVEVGEENEELPPSSSPVPKKSRKGKTKVSGIGISGSIGDTVVAP